MDCSFLRDRVTGMVWWVDRMNDLVGFCPGNGWQEVK